MSVENPSQINSGSPHSLKEHLKFIFSYSLALKKDSKIYLRILSSYSYTIAEGIENATFPIFSLPDFEIDYPIDFNSEKFNDLIETIYSELIGWFKSNEIPSMDGFIELDISYSSDPLGQIEKSTNSRIPIKMITDLL